MLINLIQSRTPAIISNFVFSLLITIIFFILGPGKIALDERREVGGGGAQR